MSPASASSTPATGLAAAHSAASAAAQKQAPALRARARRRAPARRPARTRDGRSTRRRRAATANITAPQRAAGPYARSTRRSNSTHEASTDSDRHQPQPQQRGEGRKQQAVPGQIVAGIPVLVPHREPEMFEQPDPVHLSRQIGRARIGDQPHGKKDPGHREREEPLGATRRRLRSPTPAGGAIPPGPPTSATP